MLEPTVSSPIAIPIIQNKTEIFIFVLLARILDFPAKLGIELIAFREFTAAFMLATIDLIIHNLEKS